MVLVSIPSKKHSPPGRLVSHFAESKARKSFWKTKVVLFLGKTKQKTQLPIFFHSFVGKPKSGFRFFKHRRGSQCENLRDRGGEAVFGGALLCQEKRGRAPGVRFMFITVIIIILLLSLLLLFLIFLFSRFFNIHIFPLYSFLF